MRTVLRTLVVTVVVPAFVAIVGDGVVTVVGFEKRVEMTVLGAESETGSEKRGVVVGEPLAPP